MRRIVIVLAVAALALAGCTATPPALEQVDAELASTQTSNASTLIGLWQITTPDTEFKGAEEWLRLDNTRADFWNDCGTISGSWAGRGESVALLLLQETGGCLDTSAQTTLQYFAGPEWALEARSYAKNSRGFDLLAADGSVVATLTAGRYLGTNSSVPAEWLSAPVAPANIDAFAPASSSGVEAAPLTAIEGFWSPTDADFDTSIPLDDQEFVGFNGSTIMASIPCGTESIFTSANISLAADGSYLVVPRIVDAGNLDCDAFAYRALIESVRAATTDGSTLTLYDATGTVLGTFDQTGEPLP